MRRCDRTLDQEGLGKANRPMERNRNESAESTAKDSEGQKPLPFRGNESDEEQVEPFADGLKIGRRWQNNFSPVSALVLAVGLSSIGEHSWGGERLRERLNFSGPPGVS